MMNRLAALLALSLLTSAPTRGAIIPAARTIDWSFAGVPGDITNRTGITVNVTNSPYSAKGDGVTDDTAAIQAAINAASTWDGYTYTPGKVIYLPAGTYLVSTGLSITHSGVTLRGAGMTNTIIKGATNWNSSYMIKLPGVAGWGTSRNVTNGVKGATNLITSGAHGWSAGSIILLDQWTNAAGATPILATNYGSSSVASWGSRENGIRPLAQWNRVESTPAANEATLAVPLMWTIDTNFSPQATSGDFCGDIGIEDLTFDNSESWSYYIGDVYRAANCWFYRVRMIGSQQRILNIDSSYRCTIRECVFREGIPITETNYSAAFAYRGYGIAFFGFNSSCLVENNIIYHLNPGLSMSGANSGNVIAYNLFTDIYANNTGGSPTAYSAHAGHPYMNLFEGNVMHARFNPDNYFGSSSDGTVFRNRIINWPLLNQSNRNDNAVIDLPMFARNYNIVGNVLGTVGVETNYQYTTNDRLQPRTIYTFGYPGWAYGDVRDPNVLATVLRHGNWDSVNQSIVWDGDIADKVLPDSLYLTNKPSWFGSLDWPAINPTNTTEAQLSLTNTPAGYRYVYGADALPESPPGGGGGGETPSGTNYGTLHAGTAHATKLVSRYVSPAPPEPPPEPEPCSTVLYTWPNEAAAIDIATTSASLYYASRFTCTNSGTVCSIAIAVEIGGTPTGTLKAGLYTATEDGIGTLLGDWSASLNAPIVPGTLTFTNLSQAITNGTAYYVVVGASGYDANNYVRWLSDTDGNTSAGVFYSADGTSWSGIYATRRQQVTIYQ